MNNKFFCRVVTNAYGLISNKLTLDKEIDLLRENGYSTINEPVSYTHLTLPTTVLV